MSDTAFRRRNKRCVPKRLISLLALLAFSLTGLLPLEPSSPVKKRILKFRDRRLITEFGRLRADKRRFSPTEAATGVAT